MCTGGTGRDIDQVYLDILFELLRTFQVGHAFCSCKRDIMNKHNYPNCVNYLKQVYSKKSFQKDFTLKITLSACWSRANSLIVQLEEGKKRRQMVQM